jgi:hypothetical protein
MKKVWRTPRCQSDKVSAELRRTLHTLLEVYPPSAHSHSQTVFLPTKADRGSASRQSFCRPKPTEALPGIQSRERDVVQSTNIRPENTQYQFLGRGTRTQSARKQNTL